MLKNAAMFSLVFLLAGCRIYTTVEGQGTVTSPVNPTHFNCSSGQAGDCEETYATSGSEVFKAEPEADHSFSSWAGCVYVSLDECKTEWNTSAANDPGTWPITATFEPLNPPVQAVSYTYNAMGQRITKTVGNVTTIFQYDLAGNLMAELDATGQPLRRHVHIENEPIAQISTNPVDQVVSVDYVHTDHLGTPVLLTNASAQVVADIESTPFGETFVNFAQVTHNRRFPGQYEDAETGFHYNYFRDYDPTTGRYIQSDPAGILRDFREPEKKVMILINLWRPTSNSGSVYDLNTIYNYAGSNPVLYYDPYGLFDWGGAAKRAAKKAATSAAINAGGALVTGGGLVGAGALFRSPKTGCQDFECDFNGDGLPDNVRPYVPPPPDPGYCPIGSDGSWHKPPTIF